ncbi:Long-chain-fatty-acid--AMP ligase FadD26 [compost metagenome]
MTKPKNLCEALQKSFKSVGNRNCVTFLPKGDPLKAVSLSGIEIHEKAVEMACRIQKRTELLNNQKKPILLAMSPGLDFVITFIASVYAGITIAPIPVSNNKLQHERIQNIINDCNASEVLCDESGYEALKGLLNDSTFKLHRIIDHEDEPCGQYELIGLASSPEDPAYIQYTSGSYKKPKGILLSHGNVLHNLGLVASICGFNEKTVTGSWLPHYHDMGLGTILVSLLYGSTIIFMSPLAFIQKPIRWLKMISDYKITLSGAPPFAYDLCCKRIGLEEINGLDLSSWEHAFVSSEVVHKKVIQSFQNKFSSVGLAPDSLFACYGMAEANLFVGGEKQIKKAKISESGLEELIEPCFLSAEIKKSIIIVDFITQQQLPDGEKGEIWIQSPSLTKGYIMPSAEDVIKISTTAFQKTCAGQEGKWFGSGDVGYLDGDKLYVLGRQKDTIKVNGINVSASDVEWYASDVHPNLNPAGAAAFKTNDNEACLLIETFTSDPMNIEEIKAQIRSKILSYFSLSLEHILVLKSGTLDRTSSGKIRRYTISQSFHPYIYGRKLVG